MTNEIFTIEGLRFAATYTRSNDGYYTIHITDRPCNRRSSSPPDVHMYSDGRVSVQSGREPRTVDSARAIARYWARGYLTYQRTGQFPNGGGKVTV